MLPARTSGLRESVLFKDKRVDLIYRFWELFDYENVSIMPNLARVVEKGGVVVTPPDEACAGGKTITCSLSSSSLAAFLERDTRFKELDILQSAIPTILDYGS